MSLLRSVALDTYRIATGFTRAREFAKLSDRRELPAGILFYHRVADCDPNTWTISRREFSLQLDFLERNTTVVSLGDIQQTQRSGYRDRMMTAITFDDGYSENCDWALPELIARGLPVTYFVSTHFVETGDSFPHDVAAGKLLRPNTIDQLQMWSEAGVEMGGHTHSHLNLGLSYSRDRLKAEIVDSRRRLQDWTGQSIRFFAFPFGLPHNMSQAAIDMVIEAGYEGFLSAYGAWNWPGDDPFHLQRIHGDADRSRFLNWMTLDPRKLGRTRPFAYRHTGTPLPDTLS